MRIVLLPRQLFLFLNTFFLILSLPLLCLFRKMLSVFIRSSFMLPPCLSSCLLPLLFYFRCFILHFTFFFLHFPFFFSFLFPRHLHCVIFLCLSLLSLFYLLSSFLFTLFRFIPSYTFGFSPFCRMPVLFLLPHALYLVPITKFCLTVFPVLTALFAENFTFNPKYKIACVSVIYIKMPRISG